MFIKNKIKTRKTQSVSLEYAEFAENMNSDTSDVVLPLSQTKLSYNFCARTGKLATGYGFSPLRLPTENGSLDTREIVIYEESNILGLWQFRFYDHDRNRQEERLMWFNADGYLVYCNIFDYDSSSYEINDIEALDSVPNGMNLTINDTDYMIFAHKNGVMKLTQNTKSVNNEFPLDKFLSITNAYGGIYAIIDGKRNKITYSHTNLDPTEWGLAEAVLDITDERGACNKLVYFNDYLYAFRDYGITKISKYTTTSDFSTTNLYYTTAKIYGDTVTQCGDNILFLASDGLYSFNGNSTDKFKININNLLTENNENAVACYNAGKYFLACRLNFGDSEKVGEENFAGGYTNNALVVLDLETKHVCITRGVDIHSILGVNSGSVSKVIACFNGQHSARLGMLDNSGKIFGKPLKSVWRAVKTDLNTPETDKILKEIYIKTTAPTTIKITSDKTMRKFDINGSGKLQKVRANINGKEFQIELESESQAEIESLKAKFDVVKG